MHNCFHYFQLPTIVIVCLNITAKNCLRRMMQPDTVSRLTAGEVLQHAWITVSAIKLRFIFCDDNGFFFQDKLGSRTPQRLQY